MSNSGVKHEGDHDHVLCVLCCASITWTRFVLSLPILYMDSDSDNGVLQAPRRKPSPIPPKELIPGSLRVPHDPGVDKGGQLSKEQIDYSLDDIDTELEDLDSDISLTDHMWGEHYQDLLNTRPENPEQAGSLDSSKMEAKWDLHRETGKL